MADDKSPLEQALDLFVYAPIGLALTAQEELPKLIEKGRSRVTGQVMMARMIGQFAVQQGQKEAEKQVKKAVERLTEMGVPVPANVPSTEPVPTQGAPAEPRRAPAAAPSSGSGAPSAASSSSGASASAPATAASSTTNGGGVPSVDTLAIPGYDSLSASQVVQRLAGLSADELAAVARYEAATRHRKTILGRISQLQNAG